MSQAVRPETILPKLNLDIRLAKLARPQQCDEAKKPCDHAALKEELRAESAC